MSDEEIFNFISIYLMYESIKNNYKKSDFLFDGRIPFNRISFVGPCLQEKGDYKYWWLIENIEEGIHHPWIYFFLIFKGE